MPLTRQIRGAFTALVTPFTPDGAIDRPAFEALVRRQLDACIDGLVLAASTGREPDAQPRGARVAGRHGRGDRVGAPVALPSQDRRQHRQQRHRGHDPRHSPRG